MTAAAPLTTEYLQRLLDRSRTVTVVVGPDGRVRFVSEGVEELLGVGPTQSRDVSVFEWLHPDDHERALESLSYTNDTRDVRYYPMVFRLRHAHGHFVEVDVVAVNLLDDPVIGGVVLDLRSAEDRTQIVEPIQAIAAGASHERVLELVAAALGRGGQVLRPAFVAWDRATVPDAPAGSYRRLVAVRATEGLTSAIRALLDDPGWRPSVQLAPRDLVALGADDLPAAAAASLRDTGHAGLRVGAVAVAGDVEALLISAEPDALWQGDVWPPATVDRWSQLLDLAAISLARHRAETQLLHAATHDPLTGLANRARFFEHLERVVPRGDVAVLYLDLDGFKAVNDAVGHRTGDAVLVEVATRLAATVRASDLVARLGGDEFAVAVGAARDVDVDELAGRLAVAVSAPLPATCGGGRIGVSVGHAHLRAGEAGPDLVHRADQALLAAKRARRQIDAPTIGSRR